MRSATNPIPRLAARRGNCAMLEKFAVDRTNLIFVGRATQALLRHYFFRSFFPVLLPLFFTLSLHAVK